MRRYTDSFHHRLKMLDVNRPDVEPRATQHIPEMISLIEELIEKGHAYAPGNGDVYYSVESFPEYGRLSHQRPEEMRETEKGQTGFKRSPLDFALWKASKPGEPWWESPWGPGRPGWHIECSAMVERHLPDGADIHGGGTDLLFPHHENELAQSSGAHPDHPFVRAWAHHGMVQMAADKMAKSVGNIVDVKEAVERYGSNAIRMWLLQSHYSQPIDYSEEILEEKRRAWERLLGLWQRFLTSETSSDLSGELAAKLREGFDVAMRNDFNTSEAIATLFETLERARQEIAVRPEAAQEFASLSEEVKEALIILGFISKEELPLYTEVRFLQELVTEQGIRIRYEGKPDENILRRAVEREKARKAKEWPTADALRNELHRKNWAVEDTPEGPILSPR